MNLISNRFQKKFNHLLLLSFLLTFLFSLFAIARHHLFQSNAYDLGLFDHKHKTIGSTSKEGLQKMCTEILSSV